MLLCLGILVAEAAGGRRVAPSVGRNARNGMIGAFSILWFVYWGLRLASEFVA